jgi:hypothetical protein
VDQDEQPTVDNFFGQRPTDPPMNEQVHLFGFKPPTKLQSVPRISPETTPPTPEEIEEMNSTCGYCGLHVDDWAEHTCDDFLSDIYRMGDTFLIDNNQHALVLKNGSEITYFPIPPGLLRTMDIQEFDAQVKANEE